MLNLHRRNTISYGFGVYADLHSPNLKTYYADGGVNIICVVCNCNFIAIMFLRVDSPVHRSGPGKSRVYVRVRNDPTDLLSFRIELGHVRIVGEFFQIRFITKNHQFSKLVSESGLDRKT